MAALNDPRWEGQDSQSLPDRPAHPDPSKRAEFGDPKETPSHGIPGFIELKHGLVADEDLDKEAPGKAGELADAILSGQIVPSIENTSDVESKKVGKPSGAATEGKK